MKRIKKAMLVVMITLVLMSQISCFGSFSLTNSVHNFNENIDGKFVNELVFLAFIILPVYEFSALVDAFILNTIEFWTDSNPLGNNEKEFVKTLKLGHHSIEMKARKNLLEFSMNNKDKKKFVYVPETSTWYEVRKNQRIQELTLDN